VEIDKGKRVSG